MLVPVNRHAVWHKGIESNDLTLAVPDHLSVGVTPQEQVGHERLPEDEGSHLRIRLIVKQEVQRMVEGFFLPAILVIPVQVERQACDSF